MDPIIKSAYMGDQMDPIIKSAYMGDQMDHK